MYWKQPKIEKSNSEAWSSKKEQNPIQHRRKKKCMLSVLSSEGDCLDQIVRGREASGHQNCSNGVRNLLTRWGWGHILPSREKIKDHDGAEDASCSGSRTGISWWHGWLNLSILGDFSYQNIPDYLPDFIRKYRMGEGGEGRRKGTLDTFWKRKQVWNIHYHLD